MSVRFVLHTPNKLRKVDLELQCKVEESHSDWSIEFTLSERAHSSEPFTKIADLSVEIPAHLHENAERAARNGLAKSQAIYATGRAADDVKAVAIEKLNQSVAKRSIQRTLVK